jgi:hypothetical protein
MGHSGIDQEGEQTSVKLKHDPERACPALDAGWESVFGKDHAQTNG